MSLSPTSLSPTSQRVRPASIDQICSPGRPDCIRQAADRPARGLDIPSLIVHASHGHIHPDTVWLEPRTIVAESQNMAADYLHLTG